VEVLATVRQRNAFRYGFQLVDAISADNVIGTTSRQLAVEKSTRGAEFPRPVAWRAFTSYN